MKTKELIVYLTASYPNITFTKELIAGVAEVGADRVELGIPFSDPVADGDVIQTANLRSLANGFKVSDIFEISEATASLTDLYWMGYANTFYHKGMAMMLSRAQELGVKGFIIPDLPYEEFIPYRALFDEHNIHNITFVAPTDSEERIGLIANQAKGFIYLVAYAGITGADKSEDLRSVIEATRLLTQVPIFLGFGVNEKNAKEKAQDVDGVIVGSAIIKHLIDNTLTASEKMDKILTSVRVIKESINS
ncbi:MAG: tryptophan synthase subunit alpha [Campylobacterales bacterium]